MSSLETWTGMAYADGVYFVLLGVILVVLSLAGLRRRTEASPYEIQSLGRKLAAWNVAPADGVADLARQINSYYRFVHHTTALVVGFVEALSGATLGLLALSGHGVTVHSGFGLSLWPLYMATIVGIGIGYPLAVRLASRIGPPRPRYADLRQRRLADYR